MNFQELIEFKNKEEMEASAYIIGTEDYYENKTYSNPFTEGTKAFEEYDNGWYDAEYVSTLERN